MRKLVNLCAITPPTQNMFRRPIRGNWQKNAHFWSNCCLPETISDLVRFFRYLASSTPTRIWDLPKICSVQWRYEIPIEPEACQPFAGGRAQRTPPANSYYHYGNSILSSQIMELPFDTTYNTA